MTNTKMLGILVLPLRYSYLNCRWYNMSLDSSMWSLLYWQVKVGDSIEIVRFFHCYKRGVDRVFVDHPMFLEKVSIFWTLREVLRDTTMWMHRTRHFWVPIFNFAGAFILKVWGKTGSKIYGPKAGQDYLDNELRFSLLCQVSYLLYGCST